MASNYNISVNQGDDYSATIIASGDSSALNLEGFTAAGKISVKAGSNSRLYTITGAAINPDTANLGYIEVSIPAVATSLMPVGIFPFDIDVTDGSPPITAIRGKLIVNPGIVTPSQAVPALVEVYEGDRVLVTNSEGVATVGSVTSAQLATLAAKNDFLLLKTKLITREAPTETPDGTLVNFTLGNVPVENTECVYLNGVLQDFGADNDYILNDNIIIFSEAPRESDKIRVNYYKL